TTASFSVEPESLGPGETASPIALAATDGVPASAEISSPSERALCGSASRPLLTCSLEASIDDSRAISFAFSRSQPTSAQHASTPTSWLNNFKVPYQNPGVVRTKPGRATHRSS